MDRGETKRSSLRSSKEIETDLKLEDRINQKIRSLENGGIEKAFRATKSKLERLKKLSLCSTESPKLMKKGSNRYPTP